MVLDRLHHGPTAHFEDSDDRYHYLLKMNAAHEGGKKELRLDNYQVFGIFETAMTAGVKHYRSSLFGRF